LRQRERERERELDREKCAQKTLLEILCCDGDQDSLQGERQKEKKKKNHEFFYELPEETRGIGSI